jgi:SAM-dependent methyltransferase
MAWKPDELEAVSCNFCDRHRSRLVLTRADGLNVVECQDCGLCFVNPRPHAHLIAKFYQADYFRKPNPDATADPVGYPDYLSEDNRRFMLKTTQNRLQVVLPYLDLRGARCLEVGCATGEFCHRLHKKGANPLGIDLSAHAIQHAQQRYPGLAFAVDDLLALPENQSFDAIFAFEVIEHVASPKQFFTAAARHLKPGGLLVLTTPNYDCGKLIGVEKWSGFLVSFEHLYFFSPASLSGYGRAARLVMRAWFTDRGSGLVVPPNPPPPKSTMRRALRQFLQRTHLMQPAVSIRSFLLGSQDGFIRQGTGHNLFMVFQQPR